ncbi:ArsR/SmtB family transcription factor [Glutamicibacter sp. X7]
MEIEVVLAALAEPTRRRIMEALKDQPLAVGDLVTELGISQPTVSKHLKVLREAELVQMTAQGQRRIYSIQPEPLRSLLLWGEQFFPPSEPAEPTTVATLAATADYEHDPSALPAAAHQLGRSVGRGLEQVTGRAQEILERFPRFGRRR